MEEFKLELSYKGVGSITGYGDKNKLDFEDLQKTYKNAGLLMNKNNNIKTKSHNKLIERLRKKLENKK